AMDHDPLRRGFAEFVGTFALVFIGAGSIMAVIVAFAPNATDVPSLGGFTLVGVALAHGLAIGVMVSAVGHISGGHFNPAVTLGFLVTRRIAPLLAVVYWVSQFLGAVVAAGLLTWLLPGTSVDATKLGVPQIAQIGSGEGLVIELILTFF